jgi:hypothetical protein
MTTSAPPALEIVLSKAASESMSTTFIDRLYDTRGAAIRDPKNAVDVNASETAAKATRRIAKRVVIVYSKMNINGAMAVALLTPRLFLAF